MTETASSSLADQLCSDDEKAALLRLQQLTADGDRAALEGAREHLVLRLRRSSDDYAATAALGLVNKALSEVGWQDPYNWKHRRKP